MSANLPVNSPSSPLAETKAVDITISGNNNNFVAHADMVENNLR